MKTKLLFISILIIITTIASVFLLEKKDISTEKIPIKKDRLAEKYRPAEHLFIQRAYPDSKPDIRAYEQALYSIKQQVNLRADAPQGFDAEWIQQGPGNIGARVNTVTVNPQNENIMYAGFSGGGLFRTTNGGADWAPIFDDQAFLSIGDVVIDPNDTNTIYVGTGDPNISGHPSIGDGVYKSTDAGNTWTNIGLKEQRITSKIIPHPTDSKTLYVSTMGIPFEPTNDKGLYKTTDGGENWSQILFVNDSTGIIDMVMDPTDPDILYAAAWTRVRNNFVSIAESDEAQIWKTTDGGENWEVLEGGLPTTVESRIGLAISPTNPQKIYALYVDGDGYNVEGVFKTTDGGANWENLNTGFDLDGVLGGFGWYFGKIRVNPINDEEVYILGVDLHRSNDGGSTWELATPIWWYYEVHADKHDLIFTPSGDMILATDGGLYKSGNGGTDWTDIENIPTTQFYRTAYNPHAPDLYYGGAQDNGTTGGNADFDWVRLWDGDGFHLEFHPTNPDLYFVESQYGNLYAVLGEYDWYDLTAGFDENERRNWDMPYILSASNPDQMYAGAQRVYRNTNSYLGSWEPISDNIVGEEGYKPSISTVAESPVNTDYLYAGTTNGKVWHSSDTGATWVNISAGLPERYVTATKPSPLNEATIYVTVSGYKYNDFIPHVHRSDDRGTTWTDISGNLPQVAVNDIFIYPETGDSLLFVATDGGVYATLDAGENWDRLGSNMPIIKVNDLAWNEAKNEIVAATFARSIQSFPIDSILVDEDNMSVAVENTTLLKPQLDIFPNPATDYINVHFNNIEQGKTAKIAIIDTQGKLVNETSSDTFGKVNKRINISDLASGMYFVKIKMRHQIISGQFVK